MDTSQKMWVKIPYSTKPAVDPPPSFVFHVLSRSRVTKRSQSHSLLHERLQPPNVQRTNSPASPAIPPTKTNCPIELRSRKRRRKTCPTAPQRTGALQLLAVAFATTSYRKWTRSERTSALDNAINKKWEWSRHRRPSSSRARNREVLSTREVAVCLRRSFKVTAVIVSERKWCFSTTQANLRSKGYFPARRTFSVFLPTLELSSSLLTRA